MIAPPSTVIAWYGSIDFRFHDPRHQGRCNVVFADGHAKSTGLAAMEESDHLWTISK
jgi:prepilin-type processing-associated H-X9-DG protein